MGIGGQKKEMETCRAHSKLETHNVRRHTRTCKPMAQRGNAETGIQSDSHPVRNPAALKSLDFYQAGGCETGALGCCWLAPQACWTETGLGRQVLPAGGWSAMANVACKSEVSLTDSRMSFANMFTSNISLSESGRLRW